MTHRRSTAARPLGAFVALLALASAGAAQAQPRDPWDAALSGRVRVSGTRLRDALGREVVLRGVNAGLKSGDFLPPHSAAEIASLRERTGANFVRIYVAWRAIAPAPGRFDAGYLRALRERVQRWSDAGFLILIDMHQDVWGGPVTSHGAPEWATLGEGPGLDLPKDAPWQVRYIDPRVWGSFEALYSNRVVPGTGRGLQDHYGDAWVALVQALQGVEGIVGYDLMNEPFLGNEVGQALKDLGIGALAPTAKAALRATGRSAKRGLVSFLRSAARPNFLLPALPLLRGTAEGAKSFGSSIQANLQDELNRMVRDPAQHARILAALGKVNRGFEVRLNAFYTRVGRRIQAIDPEAAIFVEPMALVGIGVPSGLTRPSLRNVVYAPHLYDAFVDSGMGFDGETARLEQTYRSHRMVAARMRAPLVLGEWGHLDTLPAGAGRDAYASAAAHLIERSARAGSAYWEARPGEEAGGKLDVVLRPFPARVTGDLIGASVYEPKTRTLRFFFRPSQGDVPTVISAPRHLYPQGVRLFTAGGEVRWRYLPERGEVHLLAGPSARLTIQLQPKELGQE